MKDFPLPKHAARSLLICVWCLFFTMRMDGASRKAPDPIVGKWKWAENITVDIIADGQVHAHFPTFGVDGQWNAERGDGEERHYTIHWQGGQYVDSITLDAHGAHLFGQNNVGWKIFAERLAGAGAEPAAAPAAEPSPPTPPAPPAPPITPPPPAPIPATPEPLPSAPVQTTRASQPSGQHGAEAAKAPWLQPGAEGKYVFVGKAIWDAGTGRKITDALLPMPILDHSRTIQGAPGLYYSEVANHGIPALGTVGSVYKLDGSYPVTPTLTGPANGNSGGFPGYWTDLNRRRVVWIEGGDYWRGEIDWANGKIVNRKQVTHLGSFQASNRPEVWWEHLLYVRGGFDKEKPVVRINLATGAVDELASNDVFGPDRSGSSSMVSPNSYRVCRITPSIIYAFDTRTGQATQFSNKLEGVAGMNAESPRLLSTKDLAAWVGDDVVYMVTPDALVAKLDFRNSLMEVISPAIMGVVDHRQAARQVVVKGLLPGGHYVEVITKKSTNAPPDSAGGTRIEDHFLIDVTNGRRKPLPIAWSEDGIWLDENRCVYIRNTGGIASAGTRLYNLATNADTRLSGAAVSLFGTILLKHSNEIWALVQQGGASLMRIRLADGTSENVGPCEVIVPTQISSDNPMDLGLQTTAHDDLWRAAPVDLASLAPALPKEAAQGRLRLIEETKSLPPEQIKFADETYTYALGERVLNQMFDPVKFAILVSAAHQAHPSGYRMNTVNLKEAFDPSSALKYVHGWALQSNNGHFVFEARELSQDKLDAIAKQTAATFVATFPKTPTASLLDVDFLLNKILMDTLHSMVGKKGPSRSSK